MVREFADWIATTQISTLFQNVLWVVPLSQSIHIICLSTLFGAVLMINLRLLGVGSSGRSISQLVNTLIPIVWGALAVLLFTGTVQTIAEPVRQFVTPAFWGKMGMIVAVMAGTWVFTRAVRKNAALWDNPATRPGVAKVFAIVSTLLWVAIIACGRFIGYTWFFYA
ncbi:MAG: hypothetical protein QM718_00325 [Steroidobacteraceae bacterium]